jgi:hypothetical protein
VIVKKWWSMRSQNLRARIEAFMSEFENGFYCLYTLAQNLRTGFDAFMTKYQNLRTGFAAFMVYLVK